MSYRIKRFVHHLWPKLVVEYFYEHNLLHIPTPLPKIDVIIFNLNERNIERIQEVKKLNLDLLKKRLENGSKCFVSEYNGQLISYHWVQIKGEHSVQQTAKKYNLQNDEAVIYHVRVEEKYRGNGINGYITSNILKECQSQNMTRVWVYTNRKNFANRKGLEKLGFTLYKKSLSIFFYKKFYLIKEKSLKINF